MKPKNTPPAQVYYSEPEVGREGDAGETGVVGATMVSPSGPNSVTRRTVVVANPSADLYGADRMVLEAVRGLLRLGWRVVVTTGRDGPLTAALRTAGAEVFVQSVPVLRKSALSPRGLIRLARQAVRDLPSMSGILRRERPAVLLVNTVTIPTWLIVARYLRLPSVVYVHEAEASLGRFARFFLAAPLILAKRVVFNSQVSRRVSCGQLLRDSGRSLVILNGIGSPGEPSLPRNELRNLFRIAYVGRLSPRKGVDLVVRAVQLLRDDGIPTEADLVGAVFDGYEWYEDELQRLTDALGVRDSVHFRGFRPSVWSFLADADVVVVPSTLDESFGNALIEALLAQRPVVAADHTGLREAAAGFRAVRLSPTGDAAALADNLRYVHDHWDFYRRQAVEDAVAARRRHDPARFQQAFADVLSAIGGEPSAAGGSSAGQDTTPGWRMQVGSGPRGAALRHGRLIGPLFGRRGKQ